MEFRVALLGITHESNTFVDQTTTIDNFRSGHWLKGDDLLDEYRSAFHEIGGMIEVLEREGVEIIPVMYAEATPGEKGKLLLGTLAPSITFFLLIILTFSYPKRSINHVKKVYTYYILTASANSSATMDSSPDIISITSCSFHSF